MKACYSARIVTVSVLLASCVAALTRAAQQPGRPVPAALPQSELETPGDLQLSERKVARSRAYAHYAWGLFLLLQEQERTAEVQEQFLQALRIYPYSSRILEQTVTPWLIQDQHDKVLEKLLPVAEEHPDAVPLLLVLSSVFKREDQAENAIALLERSYFEKNVRDTRLLRELSGLYWGKGDYESVRQLLEKARDNRELRDHFVTAFSLAMYHEAMAARPEGVEVSKREAEQHSRRALKFARQAAGRLEQLRNPGDVQNLVRLLAAQDAHGDAIALLKQARDKFPGLSALYSLLIARNLQALDRRDEALAAMDDIPADEITNARLLIQVGRTYLDLGAYSEAIPVFQRIMSLAPGLEQIPVTLAYIYLQLERPDAAIQLFAGREDPPPGALVMLSRAYYRKDDLAKAREHIEDAAGKAREAELEDFFDLEFYLYKATVEEELGDTDAAIATARRAVETAPDSSVAANFLGYVLADHNRHLGDAERLVLKAVEQEPDNAAYLDSLAWVYYRQGRYQAALREIRKALRQPDIPPDPVIYDHAGDIFAACGYDVMAARYWWQALRANPRKPEEIRRKLAQSPVKGAGVTE